MLELGQIFKNANLHIFQTAPCDAPVQKHNNRDNIIKKNTVPLIYYKLKHVQSIDKNKI